MPELPEVETVVRALRQPLVGRTVTGMWYDWANTLHSPPPAEFTTRVTGQTFRAVKRRAKYILCETDDEVLIVHLKMTGRLYVAPDNVENHADRWVHFRLQLDNATQLRFSDSRKFGKVYLTHDAATITGKIGPEPLSDDFTPAVLHERLANRSKMIKPLLLDQTFIAGVGNIYADEALHRANIHPQRRADTLTDPEIEALHSTVRAALNEGIRQQGATIGWYRKPDGTRGAMQDHFLVYGRQDEPCYTCGTLIVKVRVGQRGTHYCPSCQQQTP